MTAAAIDSLISSSWVFGLHKCYMYTENHVAIVLTICDIKVGVSLLVVLVSLFVALFCFYFLSLLYLFLSQNDPKMQYKHSK